MLRKGYSVWRVESAERLAFLVDGEAYFSALLRALPRARHSVLIAAWEIDDHMSLAPRGREGGSPSRLGDVLRTLLDERPSLHVHVLAWDFAMIYALERGLQPLFRLRFSSQPRLHLELDGHHPVGACHHQKLVVIDDQVAFVGGLDVTEHRWDRPAHDPEERGRRDDAGEAYGPFHDVQVAVQGNAAAAVGELFRERWARATGDRPEPPPLDGEPPWPEGLSPDAEDLEVGLARTRPAYDDQDEVREVEHLYLDAIAGAHRSIYLENQYLTSARIVEALAERLREEEGPEIVLVLPRRCPGWLEERTVGLLRRGRLRDLHEADAHRRLRVVYPHGPGVEDGIFVHAKLMVVDDRFATVGSANLSNRSMGLDTELNLAVASEGEGGLSAAISSLRNQLLAEHLGSTPEEVTEAVERTGGSLHAVLEKLSGASERGLRTIEEEPLDPGWEEALELGQDLADPESPEEPERLLEGFLEQDLPGATRSAWLKAAGVVALAAVLLGLWRFTPFADWVQPERLEHTVDALRTSPLTPLGVAFLFVLASLAFVPITLLIAATAVAFPPLEGAVYALVGVLCASGAAFALGRGLGRGFVRRAAGRRLNEVSRQIGRRGVLAVAAVRLVPIAPFTLVNLVAGASHVRLRDFLLGTALGVSPGILAITLLEESLARLIRQPRPGDALVVVLVVGGLALLVALVRRLRPKSGS
jgi:phospholipase D1/2